MFGAAARRGHARPVDDPARCDPRRATTPRTVETVTTTLLDPCAPPSRPRRPPAAQLLAIGLFAVVVSVIGSWHVSLWYDESATISASTRSFRDLWRLADHTNAAQVVYYALLHLWIDVAGTSPLALRLPSALAVGVTAVGTVTLARTACGPRTSLLAGLVVALLPRMTWAGIEARPYALTAAVAVWATYLAVRAARSVRPGWWVGYAVVAGVGVALYVYLALLVVAHGVVVLLARPTSRRARIGWLLAAVGAAVIAAPVLLVASRQTSQLGIDATLSPAKLVTQLGVTEWFLGDTPTPVSTTLRTLSPDHTKVLWTSCAVALAVIGWLLALAGLRRGDAEGAPVGTADLRWWLVSWLVLPAAVIGLYSVVVAPMYVPRYLTFAAPALAILIARGATVLGRLPRPAVAVVAVLCVALVAPVYVSQRTAYSKNGTDWSALARYIGTHARPGQAVYYGPLHSTSGQQKVGATLRQVEVSYPDAFRGLVDVTLTRSAAASDSLVATSEPLADATDRLAGVDTVWVLRRRDAARAEVQAEDQVLTAAAFTGRTVWTGPSDEVVRYQLR